MIYVCGFLMALADSVPGVSGGTIAFLLGYYDDFIGALDSFVPGGESKGQRRAGIIKALKFLVRLLAGWGVGFISAVLVLTSVFRKYIYSVSSLFLGFIIFSIPLIIKEEWDSIKGKYYNIIFTLLGAALVVAITLLSPSGEGTSVSGGNILNLLYFALTGMLAISAMVLPGISGSTMLLIFGTYIPVMTAIKELLHFNFDGFFTVLFFGIGVLVGILLFIRLVKLALKKFRSQTIYAILGLMAGSVFSVIQGPTTLKDSPKEAMSIGTFSIVFFIAGGAVIGGLQLLKMFFEKRTRKTAEK